MHCTMHCNASHVKCTIELNTMKILHVQQRCKNCKSYHHVVVRILMFVLLQPAVCGSFHCQGLIPRPKSWESAIEKGRVVEPCFSLSKGAGWASSAYVWHLYSELHSIHNSHHMFSFGRSQINAHVVTTLVCCSAITVFKHLWPKHQTNIW